MVDYEKGGKLLESVMFTANAIGASVGLFLIAWYSFTKNELLTCGLFVIIGVLAALWPFYRLKVAQKKKELSAKVFSRVKQPAQNESKAGYPKKDFLGPACQHCGHEAEDHEDIACRKCDCGEYV